MTKYTDTTAGKGLAALIAGVETGKDALEAAVAKIAEIEGALVPPRERLARAASAAEKAAAELRADETTVAERLEQASADKTLYGNAVPEACAAAARSAERVAETRFAHEDAASAYAAAENLAKTSKDTIISSVKGIAGEPSLWDGGVPDADSIVDADSIRAFLARVAARALALRAEFDRLSAAHDEMIAAELEQTKRHEEENKRHEEENKRREEMERHEEMELAKMKSDVEEASEDVLEAESDKATFDENERKTLETKLDAYKKKVHVMAYKAAGCSGCYNKSHNIAFCENETVQKIIDFCRAYSVSDLCADEKDRELAAKIFGPGSAWSTEPKTCPCGVVAPQLNRHHRTGCLFATLLVFVTSIYKGDLEMAESFLDVLPKPAPPLKRPVDEKEQTTKKRRVTVKEDVLTEYEDTLREMTARLADFQGRVALLEERVERLETENRKKSSTNV